jgi:hypothetical protein
MSVTHDTCLLGIGEHVTGWQVLHDFFKCMTLLDILLCMTNSPSPPKKTYENMLNETHYLGGETIQHIIWAITHHLKKK